MQVLVGCDPEIFVMKAGHIVPAWDLIPGTKDKPFKTEHGAVLVDGMAVEFNIPPAEEASAFSNSVQAMIKTLEGMLPKGYSLSRTVQWDFKEYWDKLPETAKEVGCDPDFFFRPMYSPQGQISKLEERDQSRQSASSLRTVGGHVHIGWREEPCDPFAPDAIEECHLVVVRVSQRINTPYVNNLNRTMGLFRPKPYGLEYRSPSNAWIWDTPQRENVFNQAVYSVQEATKSVR